MACKRVPGWHLSLLLPCCRTPAGPVCALAGCRGRRVLVRLSGLQAQSLSMVGKQTLPGVFFSRGDDNRTRLPVSNEGRWPPAVRSAVTNGAGSQAHCIRRGFPLRD